VSRTLLVNAIANGIGGQVAAEAFARGRVAAAVTTAPDVDELAALTGLSSMNAPAEPPTASPPMTAATFVKSIIDRTTPSDKKSIRGGGFWLHS
jgi:hypothetical protein